MCPSRHSGSVFQSQTLRLVTSPPFSFRTKIFLGTKALAKLMLVEITFVLFCYFFLSPYFYELWYSMMNSHLITEATQQWAMV